MNVKLLSYTPEPEKVVALAAKLCYSEVSPVELYQNITDDQIKNLIGIVTKNGHLSTLEHATFTFLVSEISRACTHQLVRHRMASYNQQSQRYVKFSDETSKNVVPNSINENEKAAEMFNDAMHSCNQIYSNLLDLGIPAEDARYVLPNSFESNIIVTMNARELTHFFSVRCCNRSQWEIRGLAWQMLNIVREIAPNIFKNAGPSCIRNGCSEGSMSCGMPYFSF